MQKCTYCILAETCIVSARYVRTERRLGGGGGEEVQLATEAG